MGSLDQPTLVGVLFFLLATLVGLGVYAVQAFIKGDLVPRKSIEYASDTWYAQLQEEKAKSAEWKSLYEAERALGVTSRENRDILLAVSRTMDKVLSSLPTATDMNAGG